MRVFPVMTVALLFSSGCLGIGESRGASLYLQMSQWSDKSVTLSEEELVSYPLLDDLYRRFNGTGVSLVATSTTYERATTLVKALQSREGNWSDPESVNLFIAMQLLQLRVVNVVRDN